MKHAPFSIAGLLKEHFDKKVKKNASYSLRAYARDLKISPSRLSEMMSREETPSRATVRKICEGIGYSKEMIEKTCDQFDASQSKVSWIKASAKERLKRSESDADLYYFSDDEYRYISDIIHPIIMCAIETQIVKSAKELAEIIRFPLKSIQSALHRLERFQLIGIADDGAIHPLKKRTRVNSGVSPQAIRNFHKQFSQFIIDSFEYQTRAQRQIDGIAFAVSKEGFEEFKEVLTETRKKLTEISQKYSDKDMVCLVNLQMVEGVGRD